MSRPHQYIALVSSLPHLGKLFSRKDVPISGFRLKQRLSMLEPVHAILLREMVEVTAWAGVAGFDRDIDVIRRANKVLADLQAYPDLQHLVADLVDRLFPADPLPLAAFLFHRIFRAALAMGVFADGSSLGAMGAQVERAVPAGLLPDPDTVGDFGDDGTADRAVRADRFNGLHGVAGGLCLGFGDRSSGHGNGGQAACGKTGSLKERTAVNRLVCSVFQDTCTLGASRNPIGLFPKHIALPCLYQNLIRLGYL